MKLLLDVGNTAIKWATENANEIECMSRFEYSPNSVSLQLSNNIDLLQIKQTTRILISNVAGEKVEVALQKWCKDNFQINPVFAQVETTAYGLLNAYSPPEKLGIDRWLALIAANHCYTAPICVIDCGTAVTIDGVNEQGVFIGGAILPGLTSMRQLLRQRTDAIQEIMQAEIENIFANNTAQGVLAGTTYAITSLIENMIKKLQAQSERDVTCILTGGDARVIKNNLLVSVKYEPYLVLQGLQLWGKENVLD